MTRSRADTGSQSGMALVAVLWILAALALLVTAFNASVRSGARLVVNELDEVRRHAVVQSAVELAAARIIAKSWTAGEAPHDIDFAGQAARIDIHDANGRVDLNKASPELLLAFLQRHAGADEEAKSLRDKILDWRDEDQKREANGGEDADYEAAGLDHGAADAAFNDVSELRYLLDMSYAMYRKLAPYVTVHSRAGLINPLTAPRETLRALPGVTEQAVDRVMELRRAAPVDKGAIVNALAAAQKWVNVQVGPAYVIVIRIRDAKGVYRPQAEVTVYPAADGQAPYRVLAWRDQAAAAELTRGETFGE